jgi:two-component system LytT family sensor kinase
MIQPVRPQAKPLVKQWKRPLIPLALLLVSIPIFAAAEAGLEYLRTLQGNSLNTFSWMFRHFLLPWAELALCVPLPVALARRFPFRGPLRLSSVAAHLMGSIAFGTAHLFLDVLIGKLWWNAPLTLIGGTVTLISWYLLRDIFIYWTIVGMLQAVWYQRALPARELEETRLRADLATARLAALQARLEPHFLFNTLNTAVMLVRDNRWEQAVEVLLELSELLRVVVRESPAREVPLGEEWMFIRRYLALEQARFGDRLTVTLEQDPELDRERVPFLILQPLVENALKHGIARQAGPGWVRIVARREGDRLRLEVHDNGAGMGGNGHGDGREGVGLPNVRARLHELYGERGGLILEAAPGGGTVAMVTLPLGKKGEG